MFMTTVQNYFSPCHRLTEIKTPLSLWPLPLSTLGNAEQWLKWWNRTHHTSHENTEKKGPKNSGQSTYLKYHWSVSFIGGSFIFESWGTSKVCDWLLLGTSEKFQEISSPENEKCSFSWFEDWFCQGFQILFQVDWHRFEMEQCIILWKSMHARFYSCYMIMSISVYHWYGAGNHNLKYKIQGSNLWRRKKKKFALYSILLY